MNKQNGILIILLLIGAFLFVALQKYTKEHYFSLEQPKESITNIANLRYPASEFTLFDLHGEAVQLSDYRGSVVLIMFWTTW